MPYELIADGETVNLDQDTPLGGRQRRYLLSPQDLSGLAALPDLVRVGVSSLKIEGRLKTQNMLPMSPASIVRRWIG